MTGLYKINDILNENFIRLPITLIANPIYRGLTSDAKILYSLLCNRLRLSQLNNWVNADGEVYLIYTREQAAETLGLSYKTIVKTFKALSEARLIHEERRGKGLANHLFIRKPEPCGEKEADNWNEKADKPFKKVMCKNDISHGADALNDNVQENTAQKSDMSNLHIKNGKNYSSRPVNSTHQDMSNLHTSEKDINNKDFSEKELNKKDTKFFENSQSVNQGSDGLNDILEKIEFEIFDENARNIYISAVERLYYSESFKTGNAIIPKEKIRSYLSRLTTDIVFTVHDALCKNVLCIKNPLKYVMSMIINAVCENNIELYAYSAEINDNGVRHDVFN